MALHSGRKLKQLAVEKRMMTYTQAVSAIKSIITKFGSISDNTKTISEATNNRTED